MKNNMIDNLNKAYLQGDVGDYEEVCNKMGIKPLWEGPKEQIDRLKAVQLIATILSEDYSDKVVNSSCRYYESTEDDCFTLADSIVDDINISYNKIDRIEIKAYIADYLIKNEWFDLV